MPGSKWRPELSSLQFQTLLSNLTSIMIRGTFGENGMCFLVTLVENLSIYWLKIYQNLDVVAEFYPPPLFVFFKDVVIWTMWIWCLLIRALAPPLAGLRSAAVPRDMKGSSVSAVLPVTRNTPLTMAHSAPVSPVHARLAAVTHRLVSSPKGSVWRFTCYLCYCCLKT